MKEVSDTSLRNITHIFFIKDPRLPDNLNDPAPGKISQIMAFDLTRVRLIPSGLLGLLASIRKKGIEVHLYNPSADIREVLEVTKLDQVLQLHDLEITV